MTAPYNGISEKIARTRFGQRLVRFTVESLPSEGLGGNL